MKGGRNIKARHSYKASQKPIYSLRPGDKEKKITINFNARLG
jgi:hypothetical protein